MMAITQAKRTELHQELREKLTVDTADTLMDHLPPDGWSEVAMKSDLASLEVVLKSDIARLRAEVRADVTELRAETKAEFAELRAETKAEFAELRAETKAEFAELRAETKAEFAEVRQQIGELRTEIKVLAAGFNETLATAIAKQNKWMTGVLTSLVAAMIIALMR